MSKDIDLVAYGATGFTGRLVVDYVTRAAPPGLRLAIAGRDPHKLDEIREHVRAQTGRSVEVITASSNDEASLGRMAERARVVLTTVGPYLVHGEPLVAACIDRGADYVDITGEPAFVDGLLERHAARARAAGVRIVNCCGFDSVPHDLGVYFAMRELRPTEPVVVEAFVQAGGGISGGTWHSAIGIFSQLRELRRSRPRRREVMTGRKVHSLPLRPRHEPEVSGWVLPFPSIDPQIVMRSARALELYGPDFAYGHYVRVKSLPRAVGLGAGVGAVVALSQVGPTRELLLRYKRPGEGPSDEARAKGYFRVTVLARTTRERLIARVSGGEPGYTETSKMISECALALLVDRDKLPDARGILTPAVAFGDVLLERLRAAGIRFEVVRRTKAAAA
jgi:short subunit dehydrogenase-like uncharacterized protein